MAELYHLESDISEETDLSTKHSNIVIRMPEELRALVDRGTRRPGQKASNDTVVQFEKTQEKRWAPDRRELE